MGFEEKVAPIPNRLQEKQMIKEIEESWLNQRFYKYYMNESLRKPKMVYYDRQNKVISFIIAGQS